MPWTTTNPITTENRVLNVFKSNRARKTVPYNPESTERIDCEGPNPVEPIMVTQFVWFRV